MITFSLLHSNFNYRFFTTFILCIKAILKGGNNENNISYKLQRWSRQNYDNIKTICESIEQVRFRDEAYKILKKPNIKKDTLINIAKCLEVHILKSYTKTKIIECIVEAVVGTKVDREAIGDIDIK